MAGSRGGEIQLDWLGMGYNASFGRAPLPFFSVRLEHLGHVGSEFADLYGGSMTWEQLGIFNIFWGDNTAIKYDGLKPGWTYWWEFGTWDFTVTDNLGNSTTVKANAISDLGITWDIVESPQFSIHFSAKFENSAFLIAWKYKKGIDPDDGDGNPIPDKGAITSDYLWGQFDAYVKDVMHIKYGRLLDRITLTGDDNSNFDSELSKMKTMMLAKCADLSSASGFSLNLLESELNSIGEKEYKEAIAVTYDLGNLLMIHMFASIMNGSKSVFEPWMLWHMWQWFGSSGVTVRRDRVFDLSPWWGY